MKFNFWYALEKLLIFLTSTKSLATFVGWFYAVTQLNITPEWQAVITLVAAFGLALWKMLDSIFDAGTLLELE